MIRAPIIDRPDGAELSEADLALLRQARRPAPDPDPEDDGPEMTATINRKRVRVRAAEVVRAYERTPILVTEDEAAVLDAVLDVLPELPLYQRGHALVSIVRDAETGAPSMRQLDGATLRNWTTKIVTYSKRKLVGGEWTEAPIHPPDWLTQALMSHGEWPGVPPLAGILETPTIRPDGSIFQTAGYDPVTRMVLLPGETFPEVPDQPTREDAARALADLSEPFCDFPFASSSDAMAPIAFILTLIGRGAIKGAVPMFGVDANVRGSGKSLVTNTCSTIVFGRTTELTTFRSDAEEQEKTLSGFGVAGVPLIVFDNAGGPVGGAALDKCLTAADSISFRRLGSLEIVTTPWRSVIALTGNNLVYRGDTSRRVYRCRIESDQENPEDREGFRHDPLLEWVALNRPRLVTAALTLLRAHAIAGRPWAGVRPWGSFEVWSRTIASAIAWAGGADVQATRRELEAGGDEAKGAIAQLLAWWPQDRELTSSQVAEMAAGDPELRATLDLLCPGRGPVDARRVGYGFRMAKGRVVDGRRLVSRASHKAMIHWCVERLK